MVKKTQFVISLEFNPVILITLLLKHLTQCFESVDKHVISYWYKAFTG